MYRHFYKFELALVLRELMVTHSLVLDLIQTAPRLAAGALGDPTSPPLFQEDHLHTVLAQHFHRLKDKTEN